LANFLEEAGLKEVLEKWLPYFKAGATKILKKTAEY
jgi:hypothetical protein